MHLRSPRLRVVFNDGCQVPQMVSVTQRMGGCIVLEVGRPHIVHQRPGDSRQHPDSVNCYPPSTSMWSKTTQAGCARCVQPVALAADVEASLIGLDDICLSHGLLNRVGGDGHLLGRVSHELLQTADTHRQREQVLQQLLAALVGHELLGAQVNRQLLDARPVLRGVRYLFRKRAARLLAAVATGQRVHLMLGRDVMQRWQIQHLASGYVGDDCLILKGVRAGSVAKNRGPMPCQSSNSRAMIGE